MEREITCYCGHKFTADFPEEIDVAMQPETCEQVINGTFMTITCEKCGKELKPEFPVYLYDSGDGLSIYFIPEIERGSYMSGRSGYSADRVAIGFPEFREKCAVYQHKLDDRIVEILKYLLYEKTDDPEAVTIYFETFQEGSLEFRVFGIRENEVGITKVPERLYRKVEEELEQRLQEEPFATIAAPPYVSVQKISIEDEEEAEGEE
jgi:hypothetical protein